MSKSIYRYKVDLLDIELMEVEADYLNLSDKSLDMILCYSLLLC